MGLFVCGGMTAAVAYVWVAFWAWQFMLPPSMGTWWSAPAMLTTVCGAYAAVMGGGLGLEWLEEWNERRVARQQQYDAPPSDSM